MAEQLAVEVDVKNVTEQQDKPIYFVWIYMANIYEAIYVESSLKI